MKYKIGDKVRVKSFRECAGIQGFVSSMEKYCGKETIIRAEGVGYYRLDIDLHVWEWTDDMLENVGFELANLAMPQCVFTNNVLYDPGLRGPQGCMSAVITTDMLSAFLNKTCKDKPSIDLIGEHKFLILNIRA